METKQYRQIKYGKLLEEIAKINSRLSVDNEWDIRIGIDRDYGEHLVHVGISWVSLGYKDEQNAERFIQMLTRAIKVAKEFNEKYDGYVYYL